MKIKTEKGRLRNSEISRAVEALKVLAHPERLRILEVLSVNGKVPVHEIMKETGILQGPVSHHLGLMRRSGLVDSERRGQEVWYSVADDRCLHILECMGGKGKTK